MHKKATRQNQVVLTKLQALASPQHYFREASDSDSFENYQLSIAPLQEPITISALQQTVGKLVSDLNKVDEWMQLSVTCALCATKVNLSWAKDVLRASVQSWASE